MTSTQSIVRGSIDAERVVVGCAMIDAEEADEARSLVTPDDFVSYPHRVVFEAIVELRDAGREIDVGAVLLKLREAGRAEDLGGNPAIFLADLIQPTSANLTYAAAQVRDAAVRRRLIALASEAIRDAGDRIGPADELLDRFARQVAELQADGSVDDGPVSLGDACRAAVRRYDGTEPGLTLPTGIPGIDRLTGGYRPGQLWVVGARISIGKSAFALRVTEAVAKAGHGVLVFQLEMSQDECTDRLIASAAKVQLSRLRGVATPDAAQAKRVVEVAGNLGLGGLPVWIDDRSGRTAGQIAATARRFARRHDVRLVVVDYLQLLRPDDPKAPRYQQVGTAAKRLKELARECGIAVLTLVQLNREADGRADEKPRLSHFRDSGDVEQDADVAILLHRRDHDELATTHAVDAIVATVRNGPTGTVELVYQRPFTRFEERPHTVGM